MTAHPALHLRVDDEEAVRRMPARAAREHRADDTEPVIRRRLRLYHEVTRPVVDGYAKRGILVSVDGTGTPDEVTARVFERLDAVEADPPGGRPAGTRTVGRAGVRGPNGSRERPRDGSAKAVSRARVVRRSTRGQPMLWTVARALFEVYQESRADKELTRLHGREYRIRVRTRNVNQPGTMHARGPWVAVQEVGREPEQSLGWITDTGMVEVAVRRAAPPAFLVSVFSRDFSTFWHGNAEMTVALPLELGTDLQPGEFCVATRTGRLEQSNPPGMRHRVAKVPAFLLDTAVAPDIAAEINLYGQWIWGVKKWQHRPYELSPGSHVERPTPNELRPVLPDYEAILNRQLGR
ncbi:hypothetical protein ABT297_20935 [Dactylosporangium sp. NPDC000555]|uniref:adenylate kinase family protein n=1 Tax=Dactylosporangium sp. NPDC000555 TaxID=3154260 RepID=UPI0033340FD9